MNRREALAGLAAALPADAVLRVKDWDKKPLMAVITLPTNSCPNEARDYWRKGVEHSPELSGLPVFVVAEGCRIDLLTGEEVPETRFNTMESMVREMYEHHLAERAKEAARSEFYQSQDMDAAWRAGAADAHSS